MGKVRRSSLLFPCSVPTEFSRTTANSASTLPSFEHFRPTALLSVVSTMCACQPFHSTGLGVSLYFRTRCAASRLKHLKDLVAGAQQVHCHSVRSCQPAALGCFGSACRKICHRSLQAVFSLLVMTLPLENEALQTFLFEAILRPERITLRPSDCLVTTADSLDVLQNMVVEKFSSVKNISKPPPEFSELPLDAPNLQVRRTLAHYSQQLAVVYGGFSA
jgi:hypothetical protein